MTPRSPRSARMALPVLVVVLLTGVGCSEDAVTAEPDPTRTSPSATETTAAPTATGTTPTASGGTPVTIMGAGDIADDAEDAAATAAIIEAADPEAVFTTGDNAYPAGSSSDYATKYDPTWGSSKDRTHPVPGNHEYRTDAAAGYVEYFGADTVTNSVDGGLYYAWDVGNGWRAYAVNTEISTSDEQLAWLRDDVAAHPDGKYILYGHRPRYTSSAEHGPFEDICPLWDTLAATGGLEIVLAGHNHHYERFSPMNCDEQASPDGARSFVIGSGGADLYDFAGAEAGSEFRNETDFGVFRLVLHETSYEWEFIAAGRGEGGSAQGDTGNAGQILDKGSADV
jgi:hypothetical protein